MSARLQNLTLVVAGALAVACSKPSTDNARSDQAPAAEAVPTLGAAGVTGEQSLVSAIETAERSELKLVRPAERKPPQPVAVSARGNGAGGEAKGAHNHEIDLGEVTPNVTAAAQVPNSDTPITLATAPLPRGPAPGGGDGNGAGAGSSGHDPVLFPERGPGTIIIRGGMGGIEDDCKRHPQGYPAGGIAINNRMPPMGNNPVLASNPSRRPFTPGRMGGTGGLGVPRRGIR